VRVAVDDLRRVVQGLRDVGAGLDSHCLYRLMMALPFSANAIPPPAAMPPPMPPLPRPASTPPLRRGAALPPPAAPLPVDHYAASRALGRVFDLVRLPNAVLRPAANRAVNWASTWICTIAAARRAVLRESFLRRWPRWRRRRGLRGVPPVPSAHCPRLRRTDSLRSLAGERRWRRAGRQPPVQTPSPALTVPWWPPRAKAPRRRTASLPTLPVAVCRSLTARCRAPPVRQRGHRGRPRRASPCLAHRAAASGPLGRASRWRRRRRPAPTW
jgi:hypothetical protein